MFKQDTPEKLYGRVEFEPNSGCWLWWGNTIPGGYGTMRILGKDYLTHRVSWSLSNGEIPAGKIVRHKCDTPACCNPDHILLGTLSENTQDALSRGRHRSSSSWPRLAEEQVSFIRDRLSDGWKDAKIALALGIARQSVGRRRRMMRANQT